MKVKLHSYHFILFLLFSNFLPDSNQNLNVPEQAMIASDVTFWLGDATALCGNEFCTTIRVRDFNGVDNFGFSINWDPSLISFSASNLLANDLLQGANFNETEVNVGKIWFFLARRWE